MTALLGRAHAPGSGRTLKPHLVALQSTAGNAAVAELVQRLALQRDPAEGTGPAADLVTLVGNVLERAAGAAASAFAVATLLPILAPSAVSMLIALGVRNENDLTNLVFWARYPAMAGSKIAKGDQAHAQAWLDARDSVVRPALKSATDKGRDPSAPDSPTPGPAPDRPKVPTPDVPPAEKPGMATRLASLASSGITVAAIAAHNVGSFAEFERQGNQYAKDHGAFGVKNGKLQEGVAMPLDDSMSILLEKTRLGVEGVLASEPEATGGKPTSVPVDNLAIFTHGGTAGLQSGKGGVWIGSKNAKKLQGWVDSIVPYLSASPRINLYACSTAGTPAKGVPFAEALRQSVDAALEAKYGEGDDVGSEVWGHQTVGHTTANRLLAEFERGAGSTGRDLGTALGERLVARAVQDAGREGDLSADQLRLLAASAEKDMEAVLIARRKGKGATGTKDPLQVFVREVANMGVDRVWRDVSSDGPPDYSDLGLTAEAQARLAAGLGEIRARFRPKLAALTEKVRKL